VRGARSEKTIDSGSIMGTNVEDVRQENDMFSRLKSLISAMFNRGMSKLETPEILAEQAQDQLESNLKKIKESLTTSVANEKYLEQQIRKNTAEVEQWQQRATVAVQQNNDELARQCLKKREEANSQAAALMQQLQDQKAATATLKERYKDIEGKMREFQTKKQNLIAREKASNAVASAQNLTSGGGPSGMDKWEEKIRMKEARSEANRELAEESKFQEIAQLEQFSGVDDELALLKQQMAAGSAGTPKLISDGSSASAPKLIEDKSKE
jgi:phage shock protein A